MEDKIINRSLVTFEHLQQFCGYDDPGNVYAWLNRNDIPHFKGKYNRPTTTIEAINYALGVRDDKELEAKQTIQVLTL